MTKSLRSAWRRRRIAVLLATATVAASFGWALAPVSTSAQTAEPPFSVELSQTTGLADGDTVHVTVRATSTARLRSQPFGNPGAVYMCRPGVSYQTADDLLASHGNCPVGASPSTSSEGQSTLYGLADGSYAVGDITVGTGVAQWTPAFGQPMATLPCLADSPCLLVVHLLQDAGGGRTTDHIVTQELTFVDSDPAAGCGGRDPDGVSATGSDRMLSLWARLTLAQCTSGTAAGATTSLAPDGEGAGIEAFADGEKDLAYTATGYRPIDGLSVEAERDAVYVPVALNAVVIAAIGGQVVENDPQWPVGLAKPYTEPIHMTAAEAATLVGQGGFFFNMDPGAGGALLARNPQLGAIAYSQLDKYTNPIAVQDATAVTYFGTSFFDERAPGQWVTRPGASAQSRGVHAQLGDAEPSFASSTAPISQKGQLAGLRNGFTQVDYPGPAWVLTDYATAVDLGLTPVAIENAAGEFVLPTPESIAAGVATMHREDGRLTPEPDVPAAGAYPLTMVEYAMVPAEPLVDAACSPRTRSQELLGSWLSFVTGPGQAALAPDFVPLTPELVSEAGQQIALVGTSASTAACTPFGPARPGGAGGAVPPAAGPTSGAGAGSFGPGGGGSRGGGADAAAAGAFSASTPDELDGAEELADAAEPKLPPFLGIAAVSEVISPIALLLVVVLTSGAAFLTSGRPAPPAVASGAARVRSGAGRAVRRVPFPRRR